MDNQIKCLLCVFYKDDDVYYQYYDENIGLFSPDKFYYVMALFSENSDNKKKLNATAMFESVLCLDNRYQDDLPIKLCVEEPRMIGYIDQSNRKLIQRIKLEDGESLNKELLKDISEQMVNAVTGGTGTSST